MNIADNPNVVDIMFHAPDYKVDLDTLEIIRRAPETATEAAAEEMATEATEREALGSDSARPAKWLLAVTGIAVAGSVVLAGALWRSRQS